MMHYYECYINRIDQLVTLPKDVMQDFRYQVQVALKDAMNRLQLAIASQCSRNGADTPQLLSHIIMLTMLTDIVRKVWRVGTEPAGELAKQFPRHVGKAFFFLDLMDKKSLAMQDIVETSFIGRSMTAGPDVEERLLDVLDLIFKSDIIDNAILYGYKENGIERKTTRSNETD